MDDCKTLLIGGDGGLDGGVTVTLTPVVSGNTGALVNAAATTAAAVAAPIVLQLTSSSPGGRDEGVRKSPAAPRPRKLSLSNDLAALTVRQPSTSSDGIRDGAEFKSSAAPRPRQPSMTSPLRPTSSAPITATDLAASADISALRQPSASDGRRDGADRKPFAAPTLRRGSASTDIAAADARKSFVAAADARRGKSFAVPKAPRVIKNSSDSVANADADDADEGGVMPPVPAGVYDERVVATDGSLAASLRRVVYSGRASPTLIPTSSAITSVITSSTTTSTTTSLTTTSPTVSNLMPVHHSLHQVLLKVYRLAF